MSESSSRLDRSLLRNYLLPYTLLLVLYLLVVGFGSAWLYFTARQAQTELITGDIIKFVNPYLQHLNEHYQASKDSDKPFLLSQYAIHLFKALPHLRQVSIRDRNKGYGARLTSQRRLVDVELEPLGNAHNLSNNQQRLAEHLHQLKSPYFYMDFDLTTDGANPVLMNVAFDRTGLVNQVNDTLMSVIHSIVGFSVIGMLSILVALGIAFYTGVSTQKMEARLQRVYHQAAMGQLSASLVHDLRNPLASIRANIKNLLITPDETQEIVDEMDNDLLRLEKKLVEFLTLTKPRNSGFESVDIKQLVNELYKKCEPLYKQHNITLSTVIDANIPTITVIPEDLSNALFNLLMNAINHTGDHGHVWIKVQYDQDNIKIIVEDDGSGIDESLISRVFEPFFTTREQGHGLGLAIVKRIVNAHGGKIQVENRRLTGARFSMTLPVNHHE